MLHLEGGSFSSAVFSKSSFSFAMQLQYSSVISNILLEVPFAAFAKRLFPLRFRWREGGEGVVTEKL